MSRTWCLPRTARAAVSWASPVAGASRGRLVRQLLTESGCLAVGGAMLGAGVAYLATKLLGQWTPPAPVPLASTWRGLARAGSRLRHHRGSDDPPVGLAPAWTATRRAVAPSLGQNSNRTTGAGRTRLRATLLIAQVSLSLVLLAIAGLLVRQPRSRGAHRPRLRARGRPHDGARSRQQRLRAGTRPAILRRPGRSGADVAWRARCQRPRRRPTHGSSPGGSEMRKEGVPPLHPAGTMDS